MGAWPDRSPATTPSSVQLPSTWASVSDPATHRRTGEDVVELVTPSTGLEERPSFTLPEAANGELQLAGLRRHGPLQRLPPVLVVDVVPLLTFVQVAGGQHHVGSCEQFEGRDDHVGVEQLARVTPATVTLRWQVLLTVLPHVLVPLLDRARARMEAHDRRRDQRSRADGDVRRRRRSRGSRPSATRTPRSRRARCATAAPSEAGTSALAVSPRRTRRRPTPRSTSPGPPGGRPGPPRNEPRLLHLRAANTRCDDVGDGAAQPRLAVTARIMQSGCHTEFCRAADRARAAYLRNRRTRSGARAARMPAMHPDQLVFALDEHTAPPEHGHAFKS